VTRIWLGPATAAALPLAARGAPLLAAGGPLVNRREGQILARRELSKVSIWARILHDLGQLFNTSANAVPGGWFGLIVFGVLIAVLIVVILTRVRPSGRRRIRVGSVLGAKALTAQNYRRSAARLAEAGDYSQAIIEGVRAIAAELEERGVLRPRLGRTANELAIEAGAELPGLATALRTVTRLFDDVRYGDRPGTEAGYELVSQVDGQVRAAPVTLTDANRPVAADLLVPR
jgi:hypothetical protein